MPLSSHLVHINQAYSDPDEDLAVHKREIIATGGFCYQQLRQ